MSKLQSMSTISINTAFNIELEFALATVPKRILAYIIDFVLMVLYMYGMKSLIHGNASIYDSDFVGLDILVVSFPMLIYSLITELTMNGQTVGKKIVGIRVMSLEGGEPTVGQFILRWITKFFEWPMLFGFVILSGPYLALYTLLTCFFGIALIITIAVTPKSQRLGDLLAGTTVVNTKTKFNVHDTVFMDMGTDYVAKFPQVMQLSDNDINTIKRIVENGYNNKKTQLYSRVVYRVTEVLNIQSTGYDYEFLNTLLEDYNYLATKE